MRNLDVGQLAKQDQPAGVVLYCLGAMLAEEAVRGGFSGFSKTIEGSLNALLTGLSREEQRNALQLSYELSLGGIDPAPPRLRLVYSRD